MILRPPPSRFGSLLGVTVALGALLAACSSTRGNYRDDAAHGDLLQTLRQCLVDISISDKRVDFISPCVGREVSSLNGISRSRLTDALGPPRLCLSDTETNFPEKDSCPSNQSPIWSFYRHAASIDIGGGPELVCVTDKASHCGTVEWRRTK